MQSDIRAQVARTVIAASWRRVLVRPLPVFEDESETVGIVHVAQLHRKAGRPGVLVAAASAAWSVGDRAEPYWSPHHVVAVSVGDDLAHRGEQGATAVETGAVAAFDSNARLPVC